MKKKVIKIAILMTIVLAIVLTVCGINGLFTEQVETKKVLQVLCDAFFVPGIVCFGLASLSWVSDKGAFDGLGYGLSLKFNIHSPVGKSSEWHKKETFEEYVERKHPADKKKKAPWLYLIFGGVLLLMAIVFFIVYKQI